eukprot:gene9270-20860_t
MHAQGIPNLGDAISSLRGQVALAERELQARTAAIVDQERWARSELSGERLDAWDALCAQWAGVDLSIHGGDRRRAPRPAPAPGGGEQSVSLLQ